MSLLAGNLTVSRLRVLEPELHDGWRELYRDRLDEFAFRAPPTGIGKEEVEGWCQVHNLLDTSFEDFGQWLYTDWSVFALRIDRKRLPANLLKATLEHRVRAWCAENGLERCPASTRTTLKEQLEDEMLAQTLPTVRLCEVAWNLSGGWVLVGSLSDAMVDRVRKRFYRTFGKRLAPWSPLDWIESRAGVDALLGHGASLAGGAR